MSENINPELIRKCEIIEKNDVHKVQFIAIGDKHQIIKEDNGEMTIIKLPEQGKEYRYKSPVSVEYALQILSEGHYENHENIAQQIRSHLSL